MKRRQTLAVGFEKRQPHVWAMVRSIVAFPLFLSLLRRIGSTSRTTTRAPPILLLRAENQPFFKDLDVHMRAETKSTMQCVLVFFYRDRRSSKLFEPPLRPTSRPPPREPPPRSGVPPFPRDFVGKGLFLSGLCTRRLLTRWMLRLDEESPRIPSVRLALVLRE